MRSILQLVILVAIAAVLACGRSSTPSETPVDTLAVHVVDSIGIEAGDSNYVFMGLEGAAWGPDGSMAVLDMVRGCVMIYTPDGTFRRMIGRRGNGPGELQDIGFIAVTQDGLMYLAGEGSELLGLHVFDYLSGEWLNSYSFFGPPPTCLEGGPGGLCLFKHLSLDPDNPLAAIASFGWAGPDSIVVDSIWTDGFEFTAEDMTAVVERTWYGYDMAVATDGSVYISARSPDDYRIHRWDPAGVQVPDITMEMDPVEKTAEELESEAMLLGMKAGAMGLPSGVPMSPDPFRPMIRGMEVDPEGNLWVLRGTESQPFFDIFDRNAMLTAHAVIEPSPADGPTWRFAFGTPGILAWSEDPASGCQKLYLLEYP
jgi:hypothetical protein